MKKFNSFGEALDYALDFRRLTQKEFSDLTGRDKGQISRYVNNQLNAGRKILKLFEDKLNLSFLEDNDAWFVVTDPLAQKAVNEVLRVEEVVNAYKALQPDRDDLPQLLELRDMLDEKIQELINRKS